MQGEYQIMLEAYKQVFDNEIKENKVHGIQFGNKITSLEPYQRAFTTADHNAAFQSCLTKMKEDLNSDVTICMVSDGEEYSDIKQLQQQITDAKKRYKIQFTSIAVGKDYPFALFQQFKSYFHSGAASSPNVSQVFRANITGNQVCKEKFIEEFKIVKSLLSSKIMVQMKQSVYEYIGGLASNQVESGLVVLADCKILEATNGTQINQTTDPVHIAELLQTTCQMLLQDQSNKDFLTIAKQTKQIQPKAIAFLETIGRAKTITAQSVCSAMSSMEKNISFLADAGDGKLKVENLSNEDKTKLQASFNPKKVLTQQENVQEELMKIISAKSTDPNHMLVLTILSDFVQDFLKFLVTSFFFFKYSKSQLYHQQLNIFKELIKIFPSMIILSNQYLHFYYFIS